MSEKFEQCTLEEATYVEVNGVRHELLDNVQYSYNGIGAGILWREEDTFIPEELFRTLGIKPLREKKPKPIEFEATFFKHDGKWRTLYLGDNHLPYENSMKAKFKCVQILEDEE
jgi:hypothetical protein